MCRGARLGLGGEKRWKRETAKEREEEIGRASCRERVSPYV